MKKKKARGRKSLLNAQLERKICRLLAAGHTIATVCEAVGIAERTYYEWREKYPHFSQATTRAIGQSKIFLVEKLRQSDDWRAQAFLLERRWPHEFGRSDARPLPKEPEPERQGPLVSFILSMPNGEQRKTTFEEAEKIFCNFPRKDTYRPPAKEGKPSPAPEPDSQLFDANGDDLRSNGD
jgi:hypothetical protein